LDNREDIRLVWHCDHRHTSMCRKHNVCRGTTCRDYWPADGSYHSQPGNEVKPKQTKFNSGEKY